MARKGKWIDDIHAATGKFFVLQTRDGVDREGRITAIRCRSFKFNGEEVEIPTELELNGDQSDTIPLERIANIEVKGI